MKIYRIKRVIAFSAIVLIIVLGAFYYLKINNVLVQTCSSFNIEKTNEYKILVDIEVSKMYIFQNSKLIKIYPCAGGKWSTPSHIGEWKVNSKALWGEGFGGHWLGINVPWGNFGIHGTTEIYSIGWASSHGCIRMNNREVEELYKTIPIGTKVIIVNGSYREFGNGFRLLKSGMYGSDVFEIQKRLKELRIF